MPVFPLIRCFCKAASAGKRKGSNEFSRIVLSFPKSETKGSRELKFVIIKRNSAEVLRFKNF